VVRIDKSGATFTQELKRRELLRETGLPARDLRRIDPALSLTTSAPTLLVSDSVLLINLGQVRRVHHGVRGCVCAGRRGARRDAGSAFALGAARGARKHWKHMPCAVC
jgi:hypothetical protein